MSNILIDNTLQFIIDIILDLSVQQKVTSKFDWGWSSGYVRNDIVSCKEVPSNTCNVHERCENY